MDNKIAAAFCWYCELPGTYQDDHGRATCLAHIGAGRIFNCSVYEGRRTIDSLETLKCCIHFNTHLKGCPIKIRLQKIYCDALLHVTDIKHETS